MSIYNPQPTDGASVFPDVFRDAEQRRQQAERDRQNANVGSVTPVYVGEVVGDRNGYVGNRDNGQR